MKYSKEFADLQKTFDYLFEDLRVLQKEQQDESIEDFSRRVKKLEAVQMRVIRRLWIVDSNGVTTLTKILVPPPPVKRTLVQRIKGWFK